jgi:hypothetical protein
MTTIPDAREQFLQIAQTIQRAFPREARLIRNLVGEALKRRQCTPRVRRQTAKPMSPDLAEQLKAAAEANPKKPLRDVGVANRVDGARVHETLYGKRR